MTAKQLKARENALKYGGFLLVLANALFAMEFGIGSHAIYIGIALLGMAGIVAAFPLKAKRLRLEEGA